MADKGMDPIVKEARERWLRADEAEKAQRESILAAKEFRAGNQWPDDIKIQRSGGQALTPQAAQPARPCLTIDRISQPVRQASNAVKAANISITVLPNGEHANDDTAQVFTGYLRRMQNQARGDAPIEWAADSAIESGLGWLRQRTVYASDDPDQTVSAFDQELVLERITNSLSVYCDPSSEKPTKSDAQFMIQTEDLSLDEFERRWPKAQTVGVEDVVGDTSNWKDWVRTDQIRIADYWRIVYERESICLLQDGRVVPLKEAPDKTAVVQIRVVETPRVEWYKINAKEVLDKGIWLGRRIPLFPIIGEELNVDGRKVYRGIIQSAMDAQRMVNYLYSGAVETAALAPKAPWVIAEGQDEGHPEWQHANTFNYQALYYKPVTLGGDLAPPPKRNIEEPPIQAQVELLHLSEEAIKATTAFFDPSLGNYNASVKSGRQTLALQKQQELSTSNFLDNVIRTMIEIGNEAVYIVPKITRKGQLLHILGVDDVPEQVIAGQHFVQQQGQAQPMDPNSPQAQGLAKGVLKFYDLTAGRYGVTVDVGKSATTMREEGLGQLGDLIPHLPPEMAAAITPEFISEMSFPGAQKIAEIAKKALPPQLQQQEQGGPDPRLQALQQQVMQLTQQLQSKAAEKQAEVAAKGQIDLQKTQLQEAAENQRTQDTNQMQMAKAELAATTTLGVAQAKVDAENFRSYVDALETKVSQALDLHMTKLQQVHEAQQGQLDRTHEMVQNLVQHHQALQQNAQLHQHALEQGQQVAALTPSPPTESQG